MKRLIPFLLILHLAKAQIPFLLLNGGKMDFIQGGGKEDTEHQAFNKIRKWLNSMKVSIPSVCADSQHRELVPQQQLVRPIACHEPGAINRYSFTGKLDGDLKLRGKGVLKIGSELPVMSRCIKVLDLFGEKIEAIESIFIDGVPETRALIRWGVMTGEVLLRKGMPTGFYRLERDGVWSVGALQESRIKGHCWIIAKDHILSGICEEEPWSFTRSNMSSIQVFMHDFNVAIVGHIIESNDGRSLLMAQDMLLGQVGNMDECSMQLGGEGYGRAFVFDINSLKRDYQLQNSTNIDYCDQAGPASNGQTAEGDENVTAAIRSFVGGLRELSLDPSPMDTKKAKKFISYLELAGSDDESDGGRQNLYEAVFTLHDSVSLEFFYFGNYDENGLFHGQAVLKPNTYNSCFKGECKVSKYGQIFGTFEHGLLQGLVVIYSPERDTTTYFIAKDGIAHSLVVEMGLKPRYPYIVDMTHAQFNRMRILANNGVGYLGSFRNGRIDSPVWFGMIGEPMVAQGFLYGKLNKKGKLTGDDIAYIYPDYLTALVGKFEDTIMKSGRESKIVQVTCEQGLIRAKFSRPDENAIVFFYDPPTNETMGSMHLARDPYEKKTVELQESQIPGAGQGLFAIRDIPLGQVVAMYNGMMYNAEQRIIRTTSCKYNSDQSLEALKQCMKYRINGYYGALSDIPAEYDDIQVYNATLAHKTNNHFYSYVNTYFGPMEHPRFGLIVTVTATRDIKKGEEIFVNYGYGDKAIPETEWYIEQKKEVEKELEEKKRQAEEEEKRNKEKSIEN